MSPKSNEGSVCLEVGINWRTCSVVEVSQHGNCSCCDFAIMTDPRCIWVLKESLTYITCCDHIIHVKEQILTNYARNFSDRRLVFLS